MGDMGEYYRETRELRKQLSQDKKKRNLNNAIERLKAARITFDVMQNGIHLVVDGKNEKIDYWPTTGKFVCRKSKQASRGISSLIRAALNK